MSQFPHLQSPHEHRTCKALWRSNACRVLSGTRGAGHVRAVVILDAPGAWCLALSHTHSRAWVSLRPPSLSGPQVPVPLASGFPVWACPTCFLAPAVPTVLPAAQRGLSETLSCFLEQSSASLAQHMSPGASALLPPPAVPRVPTHTVPPEAGRPVLSAVPTGATCRLTGPGHLHFQLLQGLVLSPSEARGQPGSSRAGPSGAVPRSRAWLVGSLWKAPESLC